MVCDRSNSLNRHLPISRSHQPPPPHGRWPIKHTQRVIRGCDGKRARDTGRLCHHCWDFSCI